MPANRLYYHLKPYLPWRLRMAVRQQLARRKRRTVQDIWPINEGAAEPPAGWPGWPDGKQFAFVITHDVEGPEGLAKCQKLMQLEQELGFRSSFNFVPEGNYAVPQQLREELTRNGFEVGVHDLHHDGKLFWTRKDFSESARWINQYLKDWGAVGFRAGFMLRNLDWLHELNIQYDASTFDTDPFEPQPDGSGTIFPYWISRPKSKITNRKSAADSTLGSQLSNLKSEYVELPYTLPQDSTLFLLLRETTPDIWLQKLDWIAKHGGMALACIHPDYLQFPDDVPSRRTYPVEHYLKLLEQVSRHHAGNYWQPLPREVAGHVRNPNPRLGAFTLEKVNSCSSSTKRRPKIWIDLDNTPHVPFFEPIIDELRSRGFPLLVTARDAFQVCALADKKGLQYVPVGRHYGKHWIRKGAGLAYRALQLSSVIHKEKPVLGVSHGARSQLLLGNCLRIPTLLLEDYEHAKFPPLMRPSWVMAPTVIPDGALCARNGNIRKYCGIKEDVYAWKLKPNPEIMTTLGLDQTQLIVTVRPPATEAHYHNPESEALFEAFMNRACDVSEVRMVLLPRNTKQGIAIRQRWPRWFSGNKTVIPDHALDGLNLIWYSDLVVSGGGTMNREAAALGVPVYSIFRGTIGAVDRCLQSEGRLILIESIPDVQRKIILVRRTRKPLAEVTSKQTLFEVVNAIQEIAEQIAR